MTHNIYEQREFWNNEKVVIEYNLSEPEERMAYLRAIESTKIAMVLFEILHNVEEQVVHNHLKDANEDFIKGVEAVIKHIHEVCKNNNINID